MTALTDAMRAHYIASVDAGRFDGDELDVLLGHVEALQHRAAAQPNPHKATTTADLRAAIAAHRGGVVPDHTGHAPRFEILRGNADLTQPEHDAHVRAMEAREAVRRG